MTAPPHHVALSGGKGDCALSDDDEDAAVLRILNMTEDELRADCIARGTSLEDEAKKVEQIAREVFARFGIGWRQ